MRKSNQQIYNEIKMETKNEISKKIIIKKNIDLKDTLNEYEFTFFWVFEFLGSSQGFALRKLQTNKKLLALCLSDANKQCRGQLV